jgi:hypothetical protein
MAETYGILNIKGLPVQKLATLVLGLRDNSRTKLMISGTKADAQTILLASILDAVALLVWFGSKDGQNGVNRPKSVLNVIMGREEQGQYKTFATVEDFERYRREIIERK